MHTRIALLLAALCACCSLGLSSAVSLENGIKPVLPSNTTSSDTDDTAKLGALSNDAKAEASTTILVQPPTTAPITAPTTVPTISPTTVPTIAPTTSSTTTTPTTTPTPPAPQPTPPAPKPTPPEQGSWSYKDEKTNLTCIMVQFAAQLNITYTKPNSTDLAYAMLNVPLNASVVNGSCDDNDQFITLSWPVENSTTLNTMTLNYHKNSTAHSYALKSLDFELSPDVFDNSTSNVVELSHGCEWQTPLATSYRCTPASRMNLTATSGVMGAVATLTLSRLQEEAFRTSTAGKDFSAARECSGADLPDAVPIAVGCALGGLVVVVLVAYLVGRRTSAARGYVSM